MNFKEELPEKCPPASAKDVEHLKVLRFVDCAEVKVEDFHSHRALGLQIKGATECDLAACSLFTCTKSKGFIRARKFPRLRNKAVAVLDIPEGAGLSLINSDGHVNFWMYNSFDPLSAVTEVYENEA